MPTNRRLTHRAFIRSRVLREPYEDARLRVRALSPAEPVVAAASPAQQRLEAAVFGNLRVLHADVGDQTDFQVLRLAPLPDSLDVWMTELSESAYLSYLANALPTWYPGDAVLANGHPGLRYRRRKQPRTQDAIEFYLLGERCSITFQGIDVGAFEEACSLDGVVDDLRGARTEQHLAAEERGDIVARTPHAADTLISPLIRRLGAVGVRGTHSVDIWRTNHDILSIELFSEDRSEDWFDHLLSALTSPHLSPRMTVITTEGPSGYRTILSTAGHEARLHLRVQSA